jgi:hypothetical protein
MSSATPSELTASTIIEQISSGNYPRETVLTFARGFLPLAQDDLIAVLAYLATSEDAETVAAARASLSEMPLRTLEIFAANEKIAAEHLEFLAKATSEPAVLQPLTRNRSLSDQAVAALARTAGPTLQDVIVTNQARILRYPEILDALLENPEVTADVRRRALENREEFFEKRARMQALLEEAEEEGAPPEVPLDAVSDLLEEALALDATSAPLPTPPVEDTYADNKLRAVWAKLQTMSVAEKVLLAFRGDKTIRMILVRERNKMVCSAAMRNPRMTETEVEAVATMRNVEEEVLRVIGMRRDWMTKYNIASALVRNPRAPVGVVLPIINRLTLRDLKGLKDDKNVSEVVRSAARKLYQARSPRS